MQAKTCRSGRGNPFWYVLIFVIFGGFVCFLVFFGGVAVLYVFGGRYWGGWGKQVSQYYFAELGLRHGSLYMNGKMLDLEGPTFNAFQVSEGICGDRTLVECACPKMCGISIFHLYFLYYTPTLRIPYPLSPHLSSFHFLFLLLDSKHVEGGSDGSQRA